MTSLKKAYSGLPDWLKLVLVLALLFVLFLAVRFIYLYFEKKRQQGILENSTATGTINTPTGNVPVTVNLGTKAQAIYTAFHKNDWFGISEDEEKAIIELLNVPKSLIPNLSNVYFQLYDKNLKGEFQEYLSNDDWNRVSNLFS